MAFTDTEKVDIRRFCGYPAYANFGWVYEVDYAMLETRIANMSDAEESVIRTVYLPNLTQLESDVVGTRANLDTAQAAVWTHNPREQADRENLFNSKRRSLCEYIGIRPGGNLGSGSNVIRC
jgi:hypothetical protein